MGSSWGFMVGLSIGPTDRSQGVWPNNRRFVPGDMTICVRWKSNIGQDNERGQLAADALVCPGSGPERSPARLLALVAVTLIRCAALRLCYQIAVYRYTYQCAFPFA